MPVISAFYGIVVQMFYYDHNPPHIHATYGEYRVVISIKDQVVHGTMPKRALNLIFEWMDLHRDELLEDWDLAQDGEPLKKIEPLA